jgi:DNA-binding CsgD family transcriptional regulator
MKRKRQRSVVKSRKIRWDRVRLGKVTDSEIAEALGCHPSTVRDARLKRGIPTFVDVKRAQRRRIAARMRRAGRSLSEIAAELDVSRQRAHQLVADIPVKWK